MKIIIGRGKTGKSSAIFSRMDQDVKQEKQVICFVPSQVRSLTESCYMEYQKKEGILLINITTISSFCTSFLSNYQASIQEERYAGSLEKKLLLYQILQKQKNDKSLFKRVKEKQGFVERMMIYLESIKKNELPLKELMNKVDCSSYFYRKLSELETIYSKYDSFLKENYVDDMDETKLFLSLLEKHPLTNTTIYFDGYNNFNPSEMNFIHLLLKQNMDVTISITTDLAEKVVDVTDLGLVSSYINGDQTNIFSVSNNTLLSLMKEAKKQNQCVEVITQLGRQTEIQQMTNAYFAEEKMKTPKESILSVNLAANHHDEIMMIAREIREKIQKGEYRYLDFCLVTNEVENYQDTIETVFKQYQIPVHIDYHLNITHSTLYTYMIKIWELSLYGFKREILMEILKSGLVNIARSDVLYLENYLLEFAIPSYAFNRPFYAQRKVGESYDLTRINAIRTTILIMLQEISDFFKKEHTIKQIATAWYEHLEKSGVLANYQKQIEQKKNEKDPQVVYEATMLSQMYQGIVDIFTSLDKIYQDKEISCLTLKNMIALCAQDIAIKALPPFQDTARVLDLNRSKIQTAKVVYILGVNEGKLPSVVKQDLLFEDGELKQIEELGYHLKESAISNFYMELYNLYQAMLVATEKVQFSFVSSDNNGKSLRPSGVIGKLKYLFDITVTGNVAVNEKERLFSVHEVMEQWGKIKQEKDELEKQALFCYLMEQTNLKQVLMYERREEKIKEETMKEIVGEEFFSSISKLEKFKACNFSYFLEYVLKIKERKQYQITSLDIGNFMHQVVETFSKYLFSHDIFWHQILVEKEKYSAIVDGIIEQCLEESLSGHEQNIRYVLLKRKLKHTMHKVVFQIAQSFNQSDFCQTGSEVVFGTNGQYLPIEISLSDGKTMKLIGKIDRIDEWKDGASTYIRVVDYKSSDKTLALDEIKQGISLQLATYLATIVEQKNSQGQHAIPCAMLYCNLSNKILALPEYLEQQEVMKKIKESLRMTGIFLKDIRVMEKMDHHVQDENRLIDISAVTIKSDKSSKKALDEKEFIDLCQEVKGILKKIGDEMVQGYVRINPLKQKKVCDYCAYSSICRKNNRC